MTLREWINWGEAKLLAGPHPAKARLDAEALLLHHLGKSRAWLIAHGDDNFAGCGSIGFAEQMRRRLGGEPIQYITGVCEFYGLPFQVTRDVLIPRSETEHSVEKAIELAAAFDTPRILDVGTGSGAIAVSLARHLPHAQITASDISSTAIELARVNATENSSSIRFLQGDLLEPVAGEQFDLIVSNPPYVPESDRSSLDVEVRQFEPEGALFGGTDGLDIYRRLIPDALSLLSPGGFLILEIGYRQHDATEALLHKAGFGAIGFVADLQGIPRVATARHV